ncbi:hypothetical protein P2W68_17025 [Chryseobacterium arthrosphaerae]|uniref:YncE family protein n=1 Tax=Chryseobacterium arthrosphaerae TaxID=651561 RepID=UPI0023E1EDBC|nr:hypothetical protein [Chryseobacterium arthrosphaerae]WES96538.1 hypothetical protein P2W68_17025 [Chryseobacterium arthrosphaerae]
MKKIIIFASTFLLICFSCKESEEALYKHKSLFKVGAMPTKFGHPESVFYDGNNFYVSDIGINFTPNIKDGDGKIVKLNKKGEVINANISNAVLHAPKGFVIIDDKIFINDIDAIKIINLKTGSLVGKIDFSDTGIDLTASGGTGLNDMCIGLNNQTLYVSITNDGSIYQVNLNTNTKIKIATSPGANGLFLDKDTSTLYINGYTNQKSIAKVDLSNMKYQLINAPAAKGGYDGLILQKNILYLTDWGANANGTNEEGTLSKMNIDGSLVAEISLKKLQKIKLNGPADISMFENYLFIPAMGEGKVYILPIN